MDSNKVGKKREKISRKKENKTVLKEKLRHEEKIQNMFKK